MRIVVTGGLGHIGSRLIRELPAVAGRDEIVVVDDLSTQRFASLFDLPVAGRYRFVEADVLAADLTALFQGAEAVIHLAAITDAPSSVGNRDKVDRLNAGGTERVARACLASGCRLLFASTTSVYGPRTEVVDERCPPEDLNPSSPYAESKLRAERILVELGERGLRFVTCRFGTIFGTSPGMRFHTAVNKFVWQACLGLPLTIWRTALDQKRPYLDLADCVRSIHFLLASDRFDRETYNVLTLNATVREIVEAIRASVPDVRTELVDAEIMNQLSYVVDRRKFEALGFRFEGDLAAGIAETVRLLRNARSERG